MKAPPSPVTGDATGALKIMHLVNGEVEKFIIVLTVSSRNAAWVGLIVVGTYSVKAPFYSCRNNSFIPRWCTDKFCFNTGSTHSLL